jgi:hypothetical protein
METVTGWLMNLGRIWKELALPYMRYYPNICSEELRKSWVITFSETLSNDFNIGTVAGWLINLGRIWKEVVLAYVGVLSRHLTQETEENHEIPRDSLRPGPDTNQSRIHHPFYSWITVNVVKQIRRNYERTNNPFEGG